MMTGVIDDFHADEEGKAKMAAERFESDNSTGEKSERDPEEEEIVRARAEADVEDPRTEEGNAESDGAMSPSLRPFVIISSSYLLFTITDGAIRMIVLLHAYNKGFTAMEVALIFVFYELAGVFTNLAAGVAGAKWGIRWTLIVGLCLQVCAYGMLFGWQDSWDKRTAGIYVTLTQILAGVAKDLTKLGGKTVTKLVTPDDKQTKLFKLVSLLTGWKNSLKGVGYFLGSALLAVQYEVALGVMMGFVVLAMPGPIFLLDANLGKAKKKNSSLKDIFNTENWNLNILSLARMWLFASRDFWFEVPLPFFLRSPPCSSIMDPCGPGNPCSTAAAFCDAAADVCYNLNPGGGCGGTGLSRTAVGAFLGGYIILYGQVQSWTPQLVTTPLGQTPPNKLTEILWGLINCIPTLMACIVIYASPIFQNAADPDFDGTVNLRGQIGWLVTIIVSFAVIFAINSSIHSYLVVKYADKGNVAVSVGVYYMSNAMGRLVGTLGSGLLYSYVGEYLGEAYGRDSVQGFAACFLAGTVSSLLAVAITVFIKDEKAGLRCGTLVCVKELEATEEVDEGAKSTAIST
jgi:hypothetical protein